MLGLKERVSKEFLERYAETENWFTYQDFYSKVAEEPGFKTYVEVGSWKGHSTRHLVKSLQKTGKEFVLFAVDLWSKLPKENPLWEAHPEQMPYLRHIYNYNLVKSGTRNDVFDMIIDSTEAASKFKDRSVDFCFLDASHDYASVMQDLKAWLPKIRKGGVLAGHDIHSEDVGNAVKEFFTEAKLTLLYNSESDIWAVIALKD